MIRFGTLASSSCAPTLLDTMAMSTQWLYPLMAHFVLLLARMVKLSCGIWMRTSTCTPLMPMMKYTISSSLPIATGLLLLLVPLFASGILKTRALLMSFSLNSPTTARCKIPSACHLHSQPMAILFTPVMQTTWFAFGRCLALCSLNCNVA